MVGVKVFLDTMTHLHFVPMDQWGRLADGPANGLSLWRHSRSRNRRGCGHRLKAAGRTVGASRDRRNWSGAVVLKERHDLIDRGQYRFVRHPIYTGVLLMILGTVAISGTRADVVFLRETWSRASSSKRGEKSAC